MVTGGFCDRLLDEVHCLSQYADWLAHLRIRQFHWRSTCAPKTTIPAGRMWWPTCPGPP